MQNYNEEMYGLGSRRSEIRELFEYGRQLAAEKGADAVFDFSLGNPSVPVPDAVIASLKAHHDNPGIHAYTSAQGDFEVRKKIAASLNSRFGAGLGADSLYMTCGAAASLCISFKALCNPGDEIVVPAPFFPEYKVFAEAAGARFVSVPFNPADFQPDFTALASAITPATKAVVINSPNNPSGVVYTLETLRTLASILEEKSELYGHPIFIVSDEPYREIVYSGEELPFVMNYYRNTLVCYSWSKCLSIPGERIGYIAVSPRAEDERAVYAAICGAGRALGYVCAPSLLQRVVAECADVRPDVDAYRRNRDLLYSELCAMGYECIPPDGAFYLFVKSPIADAHEFSELAKKEGLLLVPGDSFGAPGYLRIAYCVSYDTIVRSLPAFKKLKSF
ncbi:MAG: pyridoxal phosphate-dependent aminotransferase [Bacteroidales bacterium]|nr:pyridoxal phosphate-dependent aminotransferase [Bacteroidales bacterium]